MTEEHVDQVMEQDEPPVNAIEREQRAKAGKPHYVDMTADELNRAAVKEWREQSALRGPVVVPEWGNVGIFCKRLSYIEQTEVVSIHREHGLLGVFCYRALNSQGERIFPSLKLFQDSMQERWNFTLIERVCTSMTALCKTQLTDEELGNS